MKKLFLIPLLALFSCVMAFATVHTAGTFAELQSALSAAVNGDEIQLTADFGYPTNGQAVLDITKSITIDGMGHTFSGYGKRTNSAYPSFAINSSSTANETEVVFKNLTIVNPCKVAAYACRPIETRGHVKSITLENVTITAPNGDDSNAQIITIGGDDSGWCSDSKKTQINMSNTTINAGTSSYCIVSFNPYVLNATNCSFNGWCVSNLREPSGSFGSRGTIINMDACFINTRNVHKTPTNAYGAFATNDDDITINLNGCTMNAEVLGTQSQWILLLNNFAPANRRVNPVTLNITGDNSNLSDMLVYNGWVGGYYQNKYKGESTLPAETFALNISISGGTYPFNPSEITWYKNGLLEGDDRIAESNICSVSIPDGYEVAEVNQGGITLYRVVKSAAEKTPGVLYDLNDLVVGEGVEEGNNPVSSFELSDGSDMTLDNEVTTAGYVQVKDDDVNGATTVTVGTASQDQTLIINNGLDVQGESQVIVEAGSTLQIGEGGINTEKPENIVIEANENGAASLLLDPTITVNQTPNLTVKMTAKQIGKDAFGDYYWHRFAMPVAAGITSWDKEGSYTGATQTYPTYIYGWDYANNDWLNLPGGVADMVPLQGYTLTLASDYIDGGITDLQDVVYTFKGNLIGNTDQALNFQARGFNFFGNSYTGYMDVLTLIQGIENSNVEGTVYMWNTDEQSYEAVSLYKLQNARQRARLEDWQKEVAPMQTFILRLRGVDSADESVNYASAIWGNPRYGNVATPAPARRTLAASSEEAYMEIVVTAANGKSDRVDFTAMAGNSDAFESGYDAVKYMNERRMNIFSTVAGEDYSSVVTDNIEGKTISLSTKDDIRYTLSFRNVEGEAYAIRDNVTGAVTNIAEGNTYEFTAQPNALNADRFSIVAVRPVTTGVENIEAAAKAQGIYTVLGQYIGAREMWNSLPAGIYVVDGVKLVK